MKNHLHYSFPAYFYCPPAYYFHIPQMPIVEAAEYTWSSAILAPTGITIMDMAIAIHNLVGITITVIVILLDFVTGHIIGIDTFTALGITFIAMARTNGDEIGMIGMEDNFKPD
jgi:hypothetical protein